MKLYDLLRDVEYTVVREGNPEISDIIYDSRKVSPGTVFAALKGAAADGHKYACSAIDKGAAALVISDDLDFDIPDGVAVVKTDDTRLALALMSRAFFNYPERELKTVAITGTKGKSTTSSLMYTVLSKCTDRPTLLVGNIGLPALDYYGEITEANLGEQLDALVDSITGTLTN